KGRRPAGRIGTHPQRPRQAPGREEEAEAEAPPPQAAEGGGMSTQVEEVRRPQAYEPCEECGAAMDPQQRYCVNCAARRGNGANPSSRYFAAMSKRARRPLAQAPAKQSPTSRAAVVGFFALLPIAVAIGVAIGH